MTIERTFQGAISISDYIGGSYYKRQYMGYSLSEAKSMFKQYVKEEKAKTFINKKK